jgi:cell wall-associated NlpC family hydrolase
MRYVRAVPGLRQELMARSFRLIRKIAWVVVALLVQSAAAPVKAAEEVPAEVVLRALALVDAPYRYGGRTPAGFDCSGFVGYVFAETAGLTLPRRSEEIRRLGEPLTSEQLAAGDLVFFNTLGRPFSHVGIYLGDGRFVHAPARRGRVRVERIDDPYWTSRFNGARRFFSSAAVVAAAATPAIVVDLPEPRITP